MRKGVSNFNSFRDFYARKLNRFFAQLCEFCARNGIKFPQTDRTSVCVEQLRKRYSPPSGAQNSCFYYLFHYTESFFFPKEILFSWPLSSLRMFDRWVKKISATINKAK